jgi:hypothetical protein
VVFHRSENGGVSWDPLVGGQDVRPLLVHPADPELVIGDRCQLVVSQDGEETWVSLPGFEGFTVSAVALDGWSLYGVVISEGETTWLVRFDLSSSGRLGPGARLLEFWGGGTVLVSGDLLLVAGPRGVHLTRLPSPLPVDLSGLVVWSRRGPVQRRRA